MKIIVDLPDWYLEEVKEFKHPDFVDKAINEGQPLIEFLDMISAEMEEVGKTYGEYEDGMFRAQGIIARYKK